MTKNTTIVCAADANYFELARGLIFSIKEKPEGRDIPISVLDLGFTNEQLDWLRQHASAIESPDWHFNFLDRDRVPGHYRAMLARPYLRDYFPGYDTYLFIDSDAWVQDWTAVEIYIRAAEKGKLGITPQLDRSYNVHYKRPKVLGWTQNYKCFRWSYGWRAADRLGRNPILNAGIFSLPGDGPHWKLWGEAIGLALNRRTIRRRGFPNLHFFLVEQTALNYVVFHDRVPVTFLPAYCNWFCALAKPMVDEIAGVLVEPHEPHRPLGLIHLAGFGFKDMSWKLETLEGEIITTELRYESAPFRISERQSDVA